MGLRPGGGERPDIEAVLPSLYAAFYDAVAAHSRQGFDVAVDVGHHDAYASSLHLLVDGSQRLERLSAWLVGVHCPLEVIAQRREASSENDYAPARDADGHLAEAVVRWQNEVYRPGIYDLNVDTSVSDPERCAEQILQHLESGPTPGACWRRRRRRDRGRHRHVVDDGRARWCLRQLRSPGRSSRGLTDRSPTDRSPSGQTCPGCSATTRRHL